MTVLLYAIADADHPVPPGLRGLDDQPVRGVSGGGLVAVLGECPTPLPEDPEALLSYEHTVEQLMDQETVLPARYGTVLTADAAVTELLDRRSDRLAATLRRVRGAVELGVRAEWPADPSPSHPSGEHAGSDYLRGRLELRRRSRELTAQIDAAVGELARERTERTPPGRDNQVSLAYLVPRGRVEEFLDRCRELAETVTGATVVCTGPWPPYSFVAEED